MTRELISLLKFFHLWGLYFRWANAHARIYLLATHQVIQLDLLVFVSLLRVLAFLTLSSLE
jgi:hypothetical protein